MYRNNLLSYIQPEVETKKEHEFILYMRVVHWQKVNKNNLEVEKKNNNNTNTTKINISFQV